MDLKKLVKTSGLLWLCLALFLGLSAPERLPVAVLVVPYVLLFAACYSTWTVLAHVATSPEARGRPGKRLGLVLTASMVLLLGLQSLGQLSLRDVVTVAGIAAVGYLYMARSGFELPER